MSEENKALARRFYEAMSIGDFASIEAFVAENIIDHDPMAEMFGSGREGVRAMLNAFRAAFPDMKATINDMVAEGDKVFVYCTMTGTHQGEFMGMPATGKQVTVPMADLVRFENGQAVEHWGVTDSGMMMQQLGVAE